MVDLDFNHKLFRTRMNLNEDYTKRDDLDDYFNTQILKKVDFNFREKINNNDFIKNESFLNIYDNFDWDNNPISSQWKIKLVSSLFISRKSYESEEKLIEFRAKLGDKLTKEAEDKFLVNQKKSDTVTIKTYEQIEKETREKTLTSLNDNFAFISKELDREDWFSVYVNVIASRFDPHTSYFAPDEKERFDVSMSGKLEGIGARLQKKNDFTEITELISGGPAWRQKELEAGDIVLKVAQGDKDPVDVVGMRLDDVVKKIKGPKGTDNKISYFGS